MAVGKVILIPTVLHEDADNSIPSYVIEQAKLCDAYFVENEKTARRYLKKYWREMVIDNYQWRTIHKAEVAVVTEFISLLKQGKNIGIISEAGCPGVADPGQILVAAAQEKGFEVCPLVGPTSILLALNKIHIKKTQRKFLLKHHIGTINSLKTCYNIAIRKQKFVLP